VEGNRALVFEDAEALNPEPLDLDCDHPSGSVRTAVLKAVVASAAAHHVCCSDFVDRAVAIADVVEGGVVEEGVASIDPVHEVSVALVEALELGSAEQERRMRLVCHVLSGAIRLT
jgi:hypothetical protein